jgi:hypothetical protein
MVTSQLRWAATGWQQIQTIAAAATTAAVVVAAAAAHTPNPPDPEKIWGRTDEQGFCERWWRHRGLV